MKKMKIVIPDQGLNKIIITILNKTAILFFII